MYIFLIRKKKGNFLENVWPFVYTCAKVIYAKTQKRMKIIEYGLVLLERCILGILTSYVPITFNPMARRLTKNQIFNDFAIPWDSINEIDPDVFDFKDMD